MEVLISVLKSIYDHLYEESSEIAFVSETEVLSYSQLGYLTANVWSELCEQKNERIGIYLRNDAATYASVLATIFSGNTFVPIHPGFPIKRNQSIIDLCGIKTILYSGCSPEKQLERSVEFKKIASCSANNFSKEKVSYQEDLSQVAYILFTSGSTGEPKGVPISIKNLNAFLQGFFSLGFQIGKNDRFLQVFELTFDLAFFGFLVPLAVRASIFLPKPGLPKIFIHLPEREQREDYGSSHDAVSCKSVSTFSRTNFTRKFKILFVLWRRAESIRLRNLERNSSSVRILEFLWAN